MDPTLKGLALFADNTEHLKNWSQDLGQDSHSHSLAALASDGCAPSLDLSDLTQGC